MTRPDAATLARALRAAVHTHRLLTREEALRYAALVGLPQSTLDEAPAA